MILWIFAGALGILLAIFSIKIIFDHNPVGWLLLFVGLLVFGASLAVVIVWQNSLPDCTHDQVVKVYTNNQNDEIEIEFKYCNNNKLDSGYIVILTPEEYNKLLLD